MIRLIIGLITFSLIGISAHARSKPIVVLVPGFFNSLAAGYIKANPENGEVKHSPYFSKTIVRTLESQGFNVFVIDSLLPIGSLESNGERVIKYLRNVRKVYPTETLNVIGHSAGGLYTIYALDRAPELKIASLITIATPYRGVDIVDNVAAHLPVLEKVSDLIHLRSLSELKKEKVAKFLATKKIPGATKLRIYPAKQKIGGLLGWLKAKYLSWPMALTARIAGDNSDGIVSIPSARGDGIFIRIAEGGSIRLDRFAGAVLPLEHWEQVMDSRVFTLIGVTDTNYIRHQQIEIFSSIGRNLPR